MTDPGTALLGISTALGLLDRVATLAKSVGDTKQKAELVEMQAKVGEAQLKIAQITGTLSEQAAENYRLLQELHKAKDDLKAAQEELKKRGDVQIHDNIRWTRGDPNPRCAVCKGKDNKDIPVMKRYYDSSCMVCNTNFGKAQPPPDFGIPQINWPDPPPPQPPRESDWIRARN